MQSQGNLLTNFLKNKKAVILLGLAAFWVIAIVVYQVTKDKKTELTPGEQGTFLDNRSGETVSEPPGKSPESYGTTEVAPVYLGFSKLTTNGVTQAQLSATKTALGNYSTKINQKFKEVSLDVKTITLLEVPADDPDAKQALGFNLQFDRKDTLDVRLEYYRVSTIHLYLIDEAGKTVFDSGPIDGSLPPGE